MIDKLLTFEEDGHKYYYNGKQIPSVSEILAKSGFSNYEGMVKEDLEAYAKFGTAVHECTEFEDQGAFSLNILDEGIIDNIQHPFKDYTARPLLESWKRFKRDYKVSIKHVELKVSSPKLWYAGTIDRVAIVNGELGILEIKTGAKKKAHRLQTAAYVLAFDRKLPRYHVYLGNDGYKAECWKDNTPDIKAFISALSLCKWRAKRSRYVKLSS